MLGYYPMKPRAPAPTPKRTAPARPAPVPAELREELRLRLDESLDEQAAGELIDAEEHLRTLDAKPLHRRAG